MKYFQLGLKLIAIPSAVLLVLFYCSVKSGSELWFDLVACLLFFVLPIHVLVVIVALTVAYFVKRKKEKNHHEQGSLNE